MTRGLYAAAGGMLIGLSRQEVMANNLANANTPGFKLDRTSIGSFQKVLLDNILGDNGQPAAIFQSATVNPTEVDLQQGPLHETGATLDLAVEGPGWLVVQTETGELYTRNGHLARAADGTLVTSQGYPVLGEGGLIQVPDDEISIDEYGQITAGGQVIDRLRLVEPSDPQAIVKQGESLVSGGGMQPSFGSRVRQGWLENANTDTMKIMVEMIAVMRSFEMNQRIIQAQDQTIQQAIETARQ